MMPYCRNCGRKLLDDARFCDSCGAPIAQNNDNGARKTVYEGKEHKCIRCGEILGAFDSVCPACGYEIRGRKNSNAVNEFAAKIGNAQTEGQRVILIKNFPIPNTREDVFEFIILAASNIDCVTEETSAWLAKMKQAYEKAKVSFKDVEDFNRVEKIYNDTVSTYYQKKTIKGVAKFGEVVWSVITAIASFIKFLITKFFELLKTSSGFRLFCGLAIAYLFLFLFILGPFGHFASEEKKHEEHMEYLEELVDEVEILIDEGDYDAARIKASQIVDDTGWSSESEKKWEEVREELMDTIDKKEKEAKKK